MRVYRGRRDSAVADREATERLVEGVRDRGEPAVRVWRPPQHVAFGRRDANAEGYDRARELASQRGFPPVERETGGRAVAYTGRTVAFARVRSQADPRSGLTKRYDEARSALQRALSSLGIEPEEGEPPDSFCPGSHSLQAAVDGQPRKLAGLAQRVHSDAAVVGGVLLVTDHDTIADVLDPVYGALGVPFDPETVGSVAFAGGERDPDRLVERVERSLVGDETITVVSV